MNKWKRLWLQLTPQRPLRSEVERERRLSSRPTSTITPTSSVKGLQLNAGDQLSLSGGESSNRNSIGEFFACLQWFANSNVDVYVHPAVTTDSTTSEDDNVPPPLPAKMRESTDYSSFIESAGATGGLYEPPSSLQLRAHLNRSHSLSVGSGRYTNKPLPAVPQQQQPGSNNSSSTTITSIQSISHNASYDMVETSTMTTMTAMMAAVHLQSPQLQQPEVARMRRTPPTPPPKPSRGSGAGSSSKASPVT